MLISNTNRKKMNKIIVAVFFVLIGCASMLSSCQKEFLQLPATSTIIADSVFASSQKALNAIAGAYDACLKQGMNWRSDLFHYRDEYLAGDQAFWDAGNVSGIVKGGGMSAAGVGIGQDPDGYAANFSPIRQAYVVKENIDKVPDMSAQEKASVKAEMQVLIAYRYTQMFITYGGVPVISGAFSLGAINDIPSLTIPRTPLAGVVDTIVKWCDESLAALPSVWETNQLGRITKAAALAIKAKALIYAARPLFNSAVPYLDLGENNNLICLGSDASPNRWEVALNANEALITEAENNGGLHIISTGNPLADYGTATSTPSNKEVILAYKQQSSDGSEGFNPFTTYCVWSGALGGGNWQAAGSKLSSSLLDKYYKADGTDQDWPELNEVRPFDDYKARFAQMEPRFLADWIGWEMGPAANNPGDLNWSIEHTYKDVNHFGAGQPAKFYYRAGSRRWFDFPIFRLASAYLASAEAYNEMGQPALALQRLNVIRKRAGLPNITETGQVTLREIIQREWAVEFSSERYSYNNMKHWKLANLGNGIIGGPIRFLVFNNEGNALIAGNFNYQTSIRYYGFWHPRQHLSPFPQLEINKGYLIQNPGY